MEFFDFLSKPETQQTLLKSFSAKHYYNQEQVLRCTEYIQSGNFSQDILACQAGSYVFCIPKRIALNVDGKIRLIYITEEREQMMLTLFFACLIKFYNPFPEDVLSQQARFDQKGLLDAVRKRQRSDFGCYLRTDIQHFFDSACPKICLASLKSTYPEETALIAFCERLMQQRDYYSHGVLYHDGHALKQGYPMITFLAELCLLSIDKAILSAGIPYLRFIDDMLLFLQDEQQGKEWKLKLETLLSEKKFRLHEEKTLLCNMETPFTFFSMGICGKTVCLSEEYIETILKTVKSFSTKIQKTSRIEKVPGKLGMWFFLSSINKYFYGRPGQNDGMAYALFLCQCSQEHLQRIDHYVQKQARIIGSGEKTDARYRITYEEMKKYGYRSLVNEYYKWRKHK